MSRRGICSKAIRQRDTHVCNNNDGIIIYYDIYTDTPFHSEPHVSSCVLLSTPHTSRSLYPLYAPLSPSCSIHRVRGKAFTGYGDLPRRHRVTHHVQSGTVGFLMSDIFDMRPDHVVKESKVTHAQVGELASMLRILNHYTSTMRSRGSCNHNHTRLLFSSPGFNATRSPTRGDVGTYLNLPPHRTPHHHRLPECPWQTLQNACFCII